MLLAEARLFGLVSILLPLLIHHSADWRGQDGSQDKVGREGLVGKGCIGNVLERHSKTSQFVLVTWQFRESNNFAFG